MTNMLEEQRENWGSRSGFILAAVGSAVGLGNLWGFPYKLYSHGGGAFLVPYIIAILFIGIPVLILEFSMGHFTQRAAPSAFRRCHPKLEMVGWWGIILAFVIITYYPVILGYCLSYLWYSIEGILYNNGNLPWAGEGVEGVTKAHDFFFHTYLGNQDGLELGSFQWKILAPLLITWALMYLSIFKGVNLVGKIVWLTVPLPWLMLLILAIRGLTLPGSTEGLVYYLHPEWSELANPETWRFAFGQVFFSMSLAFGVMLTYASFLHRKSDINNNATIIGLSDFATSFVAGIAIFATIGAMAYATRESGNPVAVENVAQTGPSLAFVAFPYALAQLPYSAWFSIAFFLALITLGIDSGFSITESVLTAIVDKTGWKRSVVLPVLSLIGFSVGLIYITSGGLNWLGTIDDFINGTWGIAFMGLIECLALGWIYRVDYLRKHANERSDFKLGIWWNYAIRIFVPLVLSVLFFWSLYGDITTPDGYLVNSSTGSLKIGNVVGISVMILIPILSILFSLIKDKASKSSFIQTKLYISNAISESYIPVALTLSAIFICGYLVCDKVIDISQDTDSSKIFKTLIVFIIGSILALLGLCVANYKIEKNSTPISQPHILTRIFGLISTVTVGAYIALFLIPLSNYLRITLDKTSDNNTVEVGELTGVSYITLGVVVVITIFGLGWCFYKAVSADKK